MKYSQWVEKVWRAICAEAEQGPLGTTWNPLVSDRFLEEIGVPNLRLLEPEDRENILSAIEQAALLLADKGLYETGEHGARLTEYGVRFKGYSPLYLWLGTEVSERAGQFLAEAAARLRVEDPLDLYVMRRSPGTILVRELFEELDWDFTIEHWRLLKFELLRNFLIEPVHSKDDIEIRLTMRGMLYASYAD